MKLLYSFAFIIAFFVASPSAFAITAICLDRVVVALPAGDCEINVEADWIDAGSYDPTGRPLTFSAWPSVVGLGERTVRLRVSNGITTNYCWSTVEVQDHSMPSLNCEPVNIYLVAPDQQHTSYPETWYNLSDDCGVEDLTMNVPDIAGFGSDYYTVSFNHVSGDSRVCVMPITIHDAEPQDYCDVRRNSSYEHISRVRLTGGSNNLWLSSGNDGGYRWHYNHATATMFHGSSYTVHLRPGFRSGSGYRLYWRTYLDKNGDGDFTDAGELLNQWNGTGDHSFTFNSPGTFWGMSRLRVVMSYSGYATPCSGRWGEVEDVSVLLRPYFFFPWPGGWGREVDNTDLALTGEKSIMERSDDPWLASEKQPERPWRGMSADIAPIGVETSAEVSVYPNPVAAGAPLMVRGLKAETKVVIFNTAGTQVAEWQLNGSGDVEKRVLPNNLPSGTYFLRGTSGKEQWTRRVVVR